MRILLSTLLVLIITSSFSQSKQELELELRTTKSGEEWGGKKKQAFQLLKLDSLNVKAINYLVEVYGRNNQKDSIRLLFDQIIKDNPNNPKPYLLRASDRNARYEKLTVIERLIFLKKAEEIDSTNEVVLYSLGKFYYDFFIQEYKDKKILSKLSEYALGSVRCFSALCEQDESYKETLKFPLIQLVNYLGDAKKIQLYESYTYQASYFPITAFMKLSPDWKTNYYFNVMDYVSGPDFHFFGVDYAIFHINWYSKHLTALDEPVLSDTLPIKVFRFTWLRTFNHPISIRLENKNDTITLYWKESNGSGGYAPGALIIDKKKQLSLKEWTSFLSKIEANQFWQIPTKGNDLIGTDGSEWILEGSELGKYHVVNRWSGGKIKDVCLYLLKMTNLKIKEEDVY